MYSLFVCLGAAFAYSYGKGIRSETLLQQMAQARVKTNVNETPQFTPIGPNNVDISYQRLSIRRLGIPWLIQNAHFHHDIA